MSDTVLYNKYRPQSLDEVFGQRAARNALETAVKNRTSQSFLLFGPSGTGKTTMARIGARMWGVDEASILEINAASFTGVDDMRAVLDMIQYRPLTGNGRAVIVDECARLSKQAWDSMLKALEEPPEYLTWWLCTTDHEKVPETIKTRCTRLRLEAIPNPELQKLVEGIAEVEEMDLAEGIARVCVNEAKGSARQAIVNLASVANERSAEAARASLRSVVEKTPVAELCQLMLNGGRWATAVSIIAKMQGPEPEGHRIAILHYLSSVVRGDKTEEKAYGTLMIMDAFSTPYHVSEGLAPLFLSIGRVLLANQGEV